MPTNSYDLIVVGDDFAGLLAGALCARRGMRVLILSPEEAPLRYQLGPHRLPVEPLCLAGWNTPAVQRVLDELHLSHVLKQRLQRRSVGFQFVGPDVRLDVAADQHVLESEVRREWGPAPQAHSAMTAMTAPSSLSSASVRDEDESRDSGPMAASSMAASSMAASEPGVTDDGVIDNDRQGDGTGDGDGGGDHPQTAESTLAEEFNEEGNAEPLADPLALCLRTRGLAKEFDIALEHEDVFPPAGFWRRRDVGRTAAKLAEEAGAWQLEINRDAMLRALVTLPAALGTRMTHASSDGETAPSKAQLDGAICARSFDIWRAGTPRLSGDWDALRELVHKQIVTMSVETRTAKVEEFTTRWGKITGVRLQGGEELGAGHIIGAMPLADIVPMVGRKVPKRLAQCEQALTLAGYRYTWNLVVDQAGVPEGMSSPLLLVDDPDAPLVGDNAMAIYLDAPDDEGRVTVTVSAICPVPQDSADLPAALAKLRGRLRQRLDSVMPFLQDHILLAHSPHEKRPPDGIDARPPKFLPRLPAAIWQITDGAALETAMGVGAAPYNVGIKNLTIASTQVLPQLGLEGDCIAAWSAARIACDSGGKKREYKEVLERRMG